MGDAMKNSNRKRPLTGCAFIAVTLVILACALPVHLPAQTEPTQTLPSVTAAALQKKIEQELIAPCCWNMTVDQHESPASRQVRAEIANLLKAGKSKQEILDHLVGVYGERILARPRRTGFNMLAYILPVVALSIGAGVVVFFLRRRVTPGALAHAESPATPSAGKDAAWEQQVEEELKTIKS